jgi:Tfp pilus assembly protein PilV
MPFRGDAMTEPRRPESDYREDVVDRGSEAGFALILALLALMLLTFLGLALATSTSTELRIATNYRWQQQALYNAEAGIEAGRALLRGMNFETILAPARATTWDGATAATAAGGGAVAPNTRNDQWGNATRNFEGWNCDKRGFGMGYGVVLDDGGTNAPYQYKSTIFGQTLNGAFTLWIRRPVLPSLANGTFSDYGVDNDHLLLVAEGVAPYNGAMMSNAKVAGNASVQVIEILLSRAGSGASVCGTRTGQAGQGPEGAGFSACDPITGAGVTAALGAGVTGAGTDQAVK